MKKTIFLSFKPEFFRPILYGIKKYEYRKRFCKEPTIAYLYLSSPVKEVVGIMELSIPLDIPQLRDEYKNQLEIYKRLTDYCQNKENNAIPIESLQLFKEPIPFIKLKQINSKFHAPRSYLFLENYKTIYQYLKKQPLYKKEFLHKHESIYEDNIAVSCHEMKKSIEYSNIDKEYQSMKKYNMIKC